MGVTPQGCQANAEGFQWRTSRSGYGSPSWVQARPGIHSPTAIPIPWGHAGWHHGRPLPHRQWGAHISHLQNPHLDAPPKWMLTHLDAPKSWVLLFLDAHPTSGLPLLVEDTCMPSLPPSHVPIHLDTSHTWMPPNPGCRLFLDAPHIWMPPHLRAPPTWMPSSHLDASPSWITSECPAHLDVPQSRFPSPAFPIPIPQSRFPSPGCLSPHRVLPRPTHYPIMPRFPQGTQGTVVHSLPAFRWSRPRTLWARRGGALLIDLWLGLWKRRI